MENTEICLLPSILKAKGLLFNDILMLNLARPRNMFGGFLHPLSCATCLQREALSNHCMCALALGVPSVGPSRSWIPKDQVKLWHLQSDQNPLVYLYSKISSQE
jgi:hypothetical protein